ncbi:hypothetical protein GA0070610_3333 [Micromonospora echinofusca]|uniref:Uncharacterized protein n=1 Tax=Micromonospora echinofusca TaxID=47858 RepID=A0A1C5GBC0_MICEH|nr:hypothetical protein [Micromonospora echinofusca]SCG17030.1 hypothetical protein GA0070610_3333 [Micromonospora echinofusca]
MAATGPVGDHLRPLAVALLELSRPGTLPPYEHRSGWIFRVAVAVRAWLARSLTPVRLRVGLVVALGLLDVCVGAALVVAAGLLLRGVRAGPSRSPRPACSPP